MLQRSHSHGTLVIMESGMVSICFCSHDSETEKSHLGMDPGCRDTICGSEHCSQH